MSRTSQILTRVRLKLNQIDLTDIQDGEIYDCMNYIQNDIIQKTKCLEKTYTINVLPSSDSYYFPNSCSVYVKSMIYMDSGSTEDQTLDYRNTNQWLDWYFNVSGSPPQYWTMFGNQIRLSPIPNQSGSLTVWGFQNELSYNITSSAEEPEIPTFYDNALAYGVIAEYNPDYYQLYSNALNEASKVSQIKSGRQLDTEVNW